jgi:DNA repair protein RadA/Sms
VHPQWAGRCSGCGAWNSLVEEVRSPADEAAPPAVGRSHPVRLADVDLDVGRPRPTGLDELDRVLGGGLVPGSVTLLGGEPGIGKSTLLLQLLAGWPGPSVYVSAEESARQVRLRAERLGAVSPSITLHAETSLPHVLDALTQARPGLVVLVGHVTKDGGLAGPRALEHVVDTVLHVEGDRHHALRLLRATKHRFGPTHELGLFEMTEAGLTGVPDPSQLFLADRRAGVAGSAVVPTIDGRRPLVVEVQALTTPTVPGVPARRTAQGLDGGRLSMLMAVLARRAGLAVGEHDVYGSAVGGVRLTEPGLDLGICLAVASAVTDRPLPADLVAFGEVGLGGEVRHAAQAERRLREADRLGFGRAVVPSGSAGSGAGLELLRVSTVAEAMALTGLSERDQRAAPTDAIADLRAV